MLLHFKTCLTKRFHKKLWFYISGFTKVDSLVSTWTAVPKTNIKPLFLRVFDPSFHHENSEMMERHLISEVLQLMHAKCTAERLTWRAFHVTTMMVCHIMNSRSTFRNKEKLTALMDS
jgi:hypothetical protein